MKLPATTSRALELLTETTASSPPARILDVAPKLRPERFVKRPGIELNVSGVYGSVGSYYGRLVNKGLVAKTHDAHYYLTEKDRRALTG